MQPAREAARTTDSPAQDAYVVARAVTFDDGGGKQTTGRIDLYKRGGFVLESKQGTNTAGEQAAAEKAQLGLSVEKRRKGHAVRGTAKWAQLHQLFTDPQQLDFADVIRSLGCDGSTSG